MQNCERCGTPFEPKRYGQIYCTTNCQAYVWREKNPEKVKEIEKRYRENHPERVKLKMRKQRLKRKYGITIEQYDEMLKRQNGRCAICEKEKEETLVVDHNHHSGMVRGLLCQNCNKALGFAEDNIDILKALIKYLKENGS